MSPFGLDPAARPNSATNRHSNGRTGTPGSFYEYSDVGGDVFVKKGKSTATIGMSGSGRMSDGITGGGRMR